jgi:hypothetical protein
MIQTRIIALIAGLGLTAGCMYMPMTTTASMASNSPEATELQRTASAMPAPPAVQSVKRTVPTINGVGYAIVSVQPGKNLNQRRLLAIQVARAEAMRNLAEQIHGLNVDGKTSIAEAVLQSDTLRTAVSGTIRGARTVKIAPKGSDTYEVRLEVDRAMIDQILRMARRIG